MGTPIGGNIGEWRQPSAGAARLRLLLWIALFLGAGSVFITMATSSQADGENAVNPVVIAAFAVMVIAVILAFYDLRRSFGGRSIEVRTDGLVLKKPNGSAIRSLIWADMQSSLIVPRVSARYTGGGVTGHIVSSIAESMTASGIQTRRERDLRFLDVAIVADGREAVRIDSAYRDRVGCMKAIAQAMNTALLPGLTRAVEGGTPQQFGTLTVSRDGLQTDKGDSLRWGDISEVILGGFSVIVTQRAPDGKKPRKFTHGKAALDRLMLYNLIRKYAPGAAFKEE